MIQRLFPAGLLWGELFVALEKGEIPLRRVFGFGSPALAVGSLGLPLIIFLPPLYAEMGIDLALVGFLFMMVRLFDMGTDPILGVLGDHVKSRWGRRRPILVLSVPILLLGGLFVFNPPIGVSPTYLVLSMLLLYVGWTFFTLSHTAWASELSGQYHQRTRILGVVQGLGLTGALLILFVPVIYDRVADSPTIAGQASTMAWFIFVPIPFLVAFALRSVNEPAFVPPKPIGFLKSIRVLFSSFALRRVLLADLLFGLQAGAAGPLHSFFVGQVLLMPEAASPFLLILFVSSVAFLPVWMKLSYRVGKHRAFCWGTLVQSIASVLVVFLPPEQIMWSILVFILIGVNNGAAGSLTRSMMADVIDEDHVATGQNRGALFFSMLTMTGKLGLALAVGIAYPLLALIGFSAGEANDQASLDGVRYLLGGITGLAHLAIFVIMWNFPLDQKRQAELQAEPRRQEQTSG